MMNRRTSVYQGRDQVHLARLVVDPSCSSFAIDTAIVVLIELSSRILAMISSAWLDFVMPTAFGTA